MVDLKDGSTVELLVDLSEQWRVKILVAEKAETKVAQTENQKVDWWVALKAASMGILSAEKLVFLTVAHWARLTAE